MYGITSGVVRARVVRYGLQVEPQRVKPLETLRAIVTPMLWQAGIRFDLATKIDSCKQDMMVREC